MYQKVKAEVSRAAVFLVLAILGINGAAGAYLASMVFFFGIPSMSEFATASVSLRIASAVIALATGLIIMEGGRRLYGDMTGHRR